MSDEITELRDALARESWDCGYATCTDIQKRLIDQSIADRERWIGRSSKLKPCPFCGNPEPILDCLTDEDEYFVRCPSCEIQQVANHTRQHAISEWNRRA